MSGTSFHGPILYLEITTAIIMFVWWLYNIFIILHTTQSDARSTGDQEGVSSRLRSSNILSLRLIMKSFLRSFSPLR